MVVAGLLLAGFTAFYLSEQRAFRHHQIEIETSQALRTALEQISRDVRSARKDLSYDFRTNPPLVPGVNPRFLTADSSNIEFELDANDDAAITSTDPAEHKGYRRNAGTSQIEQLNPTGAGTWDPLADNVSGLTFTYWGCPAISGGALVSLAAPVTGANLNTIVQVDVSITMNRPVIGGTIVRTESESLRLRNVRCP
jgi:hypothetical protein